MGHNHCKKKSVGYYLTYEENALSISDDQDYLNKLQIFFLTSFTKFSISRDFNSKHQ